MGSALCNTGLQHLPSSLQSPKFGFAGICCVFKPVPELTSFSSAITLQHYVPDPLTTLLDGKTEVFTLQGSN